MVVMQNAVQKAARRLLRDFGEVEQLQVSVKGPSDFVSQADLRSEATLREELGKARPGYAFLMEESGASGGENWTWRWVVDPLDGTTNFLHGIPQWAISVGLQHRLPDGTTEIAAGVVYNPATNEMFWAERGGGAYMNERRLRVAARREIKDAVFATGIPFAAIPPARRLAFARTLGALMPQVAGIRRFGAAALDLCWVAAGRYDGYWELGLKAWDCAAGILVVREAGGYVTDADGAEAVVRDGPAGNDIVAANPVLHPRLREVVADGVAAAAGRAA
jgi:myo-inositol-1(or 4)-monophosphatase